MSERAKWPKEIWCGTEAAKHMQTMFLGAEKYVLAPSAAVMLESVAASRLQEGVQSAWLHERMRQYLPEVRKICADALSGARVLIDEGWLRDMLAVCDEAISTSVTAGPRCNCGGSGIHHQRCPAAR